MSNRYNATGKGLATAAATNLISLRSTASIYARLVQLVFTNEAATAFPNASLFFTTVVDTSGTAVAGQRREPSAPSSSSCSLVTGPTGGTLASVAIDRAGTPNASGSAWVWNFESAPLWVPLSLSLVFRNDHATVAGPAISWSVTWDE